jgi:hypothetical protein
VITVKDTSGLGSLGAASNIQAQITAAAQAQGVDPNLALAVANQESGFNQNAVSGAGAIGVFQLMPTTAAGLGVNPYDQSQNITGGVTYLKQLLTQYNGDQSLALAAYNAGPGAVSKYGGVPPYTETQNYVTSVLNSPYLQTGGDDTYQNSSDSSQGGLSVAGDGLTTSILGFDLTDAPAGLYLGILGLVGLAVWTILD